MKKSLIWSALVCLGALRLCPSASADYVEELNAAQSNWNSIYGTNVRFLGWTNLGIIANEAERQAAIAQMTNPSTVYVTDGDGMQPGTITAVLLEGFPSYYQEWYNLVAGIVAIGQYKIEIGWQFVPTGQTFATIAVADDLHVQFDSILFTIAVPVEGRTAGGSCELKSLFWFIPTGTVGGAYWQVTCHSWPPTVCVHDCFAWVDKGEAKIECNVEVLESACKLHYGWGIKRGVGKVTVTWNGALGKFEVTLQGPGATFQGVGSVVDPCEEEQGAIFSNSGDLCDVFQTTRWGGQCLVNNDATDLQTTLGLYTYGWSAQAPAANSLADDFVVPAGQNWTVDKITLYMYQTNAPSPTITGVNYQWFMTNPLGHYPGPWISVPVTPTFKHTFKKRDTDAPETACERRLQKINFDVMPPVQFGPGQYWLAWQAVGSGAFSGPWQPPVVIPGAAHKPGADGMQSVNGGVYNYVVDSGPAQTQQDFVFVLHGTGGQPGAGDGDLDCDGVVNAFDIDPFVLALTNPGAYQQQYPNCDIMNADLNDDGVINAFDIDPFVVCLTTGSC